jgi:uncharacterized protein YaeQ
MALKSTIYKAELSVADMDRQHYETYPLTLARHPSENEQRMMVRILAFARHAGPALAFAKGISDNSEPDLWAIDDTGAIDTWIELGQVDEKRLRQACGRARQVIIYCYNGAASDIWWQQNQSRIQRFDNLSVFNVPPASVEALGALAERGMRLSVSIQDGEVMFSSEIGTAQVQIQTLASATR